MALQLSSLDVRGHTVDEIGFTPDLGAYSFYPSANGSLKGIFLDVNGHQVGSSISYNFTADTAFDFNAAAGGTLDPKAVGFLGTFSQATNFGLGDYDSIAADGNGVPLSASTRYGFGRVGRGVVQTM